MIESQNRYQVTPVILCGGSGTRLWPLSRTGFPKQFLCLTGNESLFQQAAQRLADLGNADIQVTAPLIVTGEDHRFLASEQLREVGIELGSALLEPIPPESVDYAAMEQCPGSKFPIKMVPLDAGWNDLGAWDDPLAEFCKVNVAGTLNLAKQAALAGAKRFVFLSSIKVNGEETQPGGPYSAHDVPAPEDAYGISKAEAEAGLRLLSLETGMEVVIIRPPLVYGPGVKGNFSSLLRWVACGLPLPLGSATTNRRSLVGLDNLVDLILTCVDHPKAANQTLLVSDGEDLSTAGCAVGLLGATGFLMLVPAKYEATVVIQPATIGMIVATTTTTTTTTTTVEPVAQTIERLKLVTFYGDDTVKVCQAGSAKDLADGVKVSIVKGNNLVSLVYRADSVALAEACMAKIVGQLSQSQIDIATPLIKELEDQRASTKQQIDDAERFLAKHEKGLSSAPTGAVLLMLKREELMKLQKLYREQRIQLTEPLTQSMKLLEPIYVPERAVFPKKLLTVAGGFISGLFLALLALFINRAWRRYKSMSA